MTLQLEHGKWGEDLAADYLLQNGLEILDRNWRFRRAEVDIIAREGSVLVFVEVKTRADTAFGRPEEMVGYRKRRMMIAAAAGYAAQTGYDGEIRFDIISITGIPGDIREITHFRDAFYPGQGNWLAGPSGGG